MKVCVHGSYGTGNRGDDVILSRLLLLLAEELPGAEVTLLCRNEQRVSLFLEVEHKGIDLDVRPLHASFRRHPFGVLRAALGSDLFILGGGGLLWGGAPGNLAYWLTRPRLAKLAGRRLAFYLPGIYGLAGGRAKRLLGRLARKSDFLSVRDTEGLQQLIGCGVPESDIVMGADPAFQLTPPEPGQIEEIRSALGLEGRRLVGLSARDWRRRLSAGIFANMVRTLLDEENVTLIFFAMKTGGKLGETDTDDITVARSLLRTLPEPLQQRVVLVDDGYRDDEVLALMGACEYLLAMRLHALIFATISGTPFGAVAYDDKIRAYMEMLGRRDFMLDMKDVTEPGSLQQIIDNLHAERERVPEGPMPELMVTAAGLASRSMDVHRALAERLREWFPGIAKPRQ